MKIKVNNIELFYEKSGNGTPLILLHGNGEDHSIFHKISEKLKNDFTVYAIDSRNHGESTKTLDYSYATMAEDIFSFIKSLNLERVNLVGFSDGAIISLLLAMKHSGVIGKMALLGVNLKPSDFTEESYEYIKAMYSENKDPLFKLMLEEPNIEMDEIKSVNVPTLVIAGEKDVFKPEIYIEISKTMPKAQLLIMKGHEHDSYIVNEDILYDDLVRFFNLERE